MRKLRNIISRALESEARAISKFCDNGIDEVQAAIEVIANSEGLLVVSGIGKSGHIARKLASTFRSLGRRSVFLHPAEAGHGDLGLIEPGGIALILSNSGETGELGDLMAYCMCHRIPIISITSSAESTLGRASQVCVAYGDVEEVCVAGLAPTTSTTLALAIGDAIAVGVSHLAKLTAEDFRKFHPNGNLGKRLRRVRDVMHRGSRLPVIPRDATMGRAVTEIAEKSLGCVLIQEDGELLGIITDGDIRRNANRLMELKPIEIATREPLTICGDLSLEDAARKLTQAKVTVGVVRCEGAPVEGLIHLHQCVMH